MRPIFSSIAAFSDPITPSTSVKVSRGSEIAFGFQIRSSAGLQYYSVALVTLLFYDYFLTLPDEVCLIFVRVVTALSSSRLDKLYVGGQEVMGCVVSSPGPPFAALRCLKSSQYSSWCVSWLRLEFQTHPSRRIGTCRWHTPYGVPFVSVPANIQTIPT